jgi:uncharacterized protein (TIGR04255 family)
MIFPNSERVIYRKNPLAEVSAELRFPPILKIDSSPPADFQDEIRSEFTSYQQSRESINLPPTAPQAVQNIFKSIPINSGPTNHLFTTDDKKLQVVLTREKIALKTISYARWEDFQACFEKVRSVFERIYRPNAYSRVSLRYVDVIRRSILGLEAVPWSDLIDPAVGGALTSPELSVGIDSASSECHCELDDNNCFLTLKTTIVLAEKERCFVINGDFHTHSQTEAKNVGHTLGVFNRQAGRLFRWAIKKQLHDALQPTPLK